MHLAARRERLDQPPFGGGEVLEAVGEDGRPFHEPSSAVSRSTARRRSMPRSPSAEPRQLGAVCLRHIRELGREIVGLEQAASISLSAPASESA